jgi:pyruvate formate lyase activating enzyme
MDRYGLIPTTLIDYPGRVAAAIFTVGCNLRCPWCQNPGLVSPPWATGLLGLDEVMDFLSRRRRVLGGVVVTGGEPLFDPDLPMVLERLGTLGVPLKLDTNGTFPERLERLPAGSVDYVAVDIKNAPSAYWRSAGIPVHVAKLRRTLDYVGTRFSGAGEIRLTWVPGLNEEETLENYARFVGTGLPVWVQGYRPGPVLDAAFRVTPAPSSDVLVRVVDRLVGLGLDARLR